MAEIYSNQINMEGGANYSTDRSGEYVNPMGNYIQQLGKDLNTIGSEIQQISDKRAVAYMEQNSQAISDMLDRWDMTTQGGVKEMEAAAKKMYDDAISSLPMMTRNNFEVNNPYYKRTMDTLIKKKVREKGVKHVAKQFSNDMLQNAYNSYKNSKGNANIVLKNLTGQLNTLANDPVLSMDPDEVDALQMKYGKEYLLTALDMMMYDGNYAGANALLGSKEASAYLGGQKIAEYLSAIKRGIASEGGGSGGSGKSKVSDTDAMDKVFDATVRANALYGMSYEDATLAATQKMQKLSHAFEVGDSQTIQALLGDDPAALAYFASMGPIERMKLGSAYGNKLQELAGTQQDVANRLSAINRVYGSIIDKDVSKDKDKGSIDIDKITPEDRVALRASIRNVEGITLTNQQSNTIAEAKRVSENLEGLLSTIMSTPVDTHYSQVATGWFNQASTSIFNGYSELPVAATVGGTFFKDSEVEGASSVFDGDWFSVHGLQDPNKEVYGMSKWFKTDGTKYANMPEEMSLKQAAVIFKGKQYEDAPHGLAGPIIADTDVQEFAERLGQTIEPKKNAPKGFDLVESVRGDSEFWNYMRSSGYFWDEANNRFVRDPNIYDEEFYKSAEFGIDILSEALGYEDVPPINSEAGFIFYMADRLKKLSDSPDCAEERKRLGVPAGFFSGEKATQTVLNVHDKHFHDEEFLQPIDTVRILNGAQKRPDGENIDLINDNLYGKVKSITEEFVGVGTFDDKTIEAIAGSYRRVIKPAKSWDATSHRTKSTKSPVYKQAARAGYSEKMAVKRSN